MIIQLYKYDSKGRLRTWGIFVEGDEYWTQSGINDGGKMNASAKTKCFPKNVGKKNETTGEQQAILEAESKVNKKKVKELDNNTFVS